MKKITERINKKLQALLEECRAAEGEKLEQLYRLYGDIEDAEYTDDHTLRVYFVTKAYGNEGGYKGTIDLMTDAEYEKARPKPFYNPFADRYEQPCTSNGFAANSLARFIGECGSKVKAITYVEWKD